MEDYNKAPARTPRKTIETLKATKKSASQLKGPRELHFSQWAPATMDLVDVNAEVILAEKVAEFAAAETAGQTLEVVDIGCGSGAVGRLLGESSPQLHVDGIDISLSLLALAEQALRSDGEPCYRDLLECDLRKPLYFAANHYDILVSAGLFAPGLLGASDLVAMVQSVKPRGRVIVSIDRSHFDNAAFKIVLREAVWSETITEPLYAEVDVYRPSNKNFGAKALIAQFSKVPTLNDL